MYTCYSVVRAGQLANIYPVPNYGKAFKAGLPCPGGLSTAPNELEDVLLWDWGRRNLGGHRGMTEPVELPPILRDKHYGEASVFTPATARTRTR